MGRQLVPQFSHVVVREKRRAERKQREVEKRTRLHAEIEAELAKTLVEFPEIDRRHRVRSGH